MARTSHPDEKFSILPKVINGSIAGMISVACIFPLDLVKTRLQNQQLGPNGEKQYKNMFDCFRKTYQAAGLRGLYRGSFVNILLVGPEKSLKLAANDYFRWKLTKNGQLTLANETLAGGLAGLFQVLVSTPMELLKIQLQNAGRLTSDNQTKQVSGRSIAIQLLKERGLFGLYRGIGATALRDVGFSSIYFPLAFTLNTFGPRREDGSAVSWISFLAGISSGAISALAVTPFDVVKTRLQALEKRTGEKEFHGIWDCLTKTYKYEGFKSLFKGGLCRVMVIAPAYGIIQMVYFLGIGEKLLGIKRSKY